MTRTPTPGSLDAVHATPEGIDRYQAAVAYIEKAEKSAARGRAVRDVELRELCKQHGPTKVAELTGASLGTIKAANRPANDRMPEGWHPGKDQR